MPSSSSEEEDESGLPTLVAMEEGKKAAALSKAPSDEADELLDNLVEGNPLRRASTRMSKAEIAQAAQQEALAALLEDSDSDNNSSSSSLHEEEVQLENQRLASLAAIPKPESVEALSTVLESDDEKKPEAKKPKPSLIDSDTDEDAMPPPPTQPTQRAVSEQSTGSTKRSRSRTGRARAARRNSDGSGVTSLRSDSGESLHHRSKSPKASARLLREQHARKGTVVSEEEFVPPPLTRRASRSLSPVPSSSSAQQSERPITPRSAQPRRGVRTARKQGSKMRDFSEPAFASTRRAGASSGSLRDLTRAGTRRSSGTIPPRTAYSLGGSERVKATAGESRATSERGRMDASTSFVPTQDLSEGSDFDMEWRPTRRLGDHLSRSTGNLDESNKSTSKHDSIASVDMTAMNDSLDLEGKIGNLSYKPVTAASRAATRGIRRSNTGDKSASSTLFQSRGSQDEVDQSINLMGFESDGQSASGGSGSDSGRAKRSTSTISKREHMAAPTRPTRLSQEKSVPERVDSGMFGNMSLMDFMSDPKAAMEQAKLGADSEQTRTTTNARKAARRSRKDKKKKKAGTLKWWVWPMVFVALVLAGVVGLLFGTGLKSAVGLEASKSGETLEVEDTAHFKDGLIALPSHKPHKIHPGDISVEDPRDIIDVFNDGRESFHMSEARHEQLSELQALIVQHGISKSDDFNFQQYQESYDQFVTMTPQTKALIWLADAAIADQLGEMRDIQHHKLLQRYALAVLYYSTHGNKKNNEAAFVTTEEFPTSHLLQMKHHSMWIRDENWLTTGSVCSWYGIRCDDDAKDHEIILALNLPHNGLHGSFPFQELTHAMRWDLLELDLTGNDLIGSVFSGAPTTVSNDTTVKDDISWPRLQYLHLADNRLNGSLPFDWLNGCTLLKEVDMSSNKFSGALPDRAFENMPTLEKLRLDHNNLGGSVVLPYLGHLKRLSKWL